MRLSLFVSACLALAALSASPWPADAQSRNRAGARVADEAYPGAGYSRDRRRTRITVRRGRSFLDPGTESLPLDRSYTDYAVPPLWYPSKTWDAAGSYRFPLPESYYLPDYIR